MNSMPYVRDNIVTEDTLTPEQAIALRAILHFMTLAADHERQKEDYNAQANRFVLDLYDSSPHVTLNVLSTLTGKSSTAMDKRLKRARDESQ